MKGNFAEKSNVKDKQKSKVVALIPARGASKEVPRKNLRLVAGRPLIALTIEQALACPAIDRVIVSTEDAEISRAARQAGAEVPFKRPARLGRDETTDLEIFQHFVQWCEENEVPAIEMVVWLRCTCPLRDPSDIAAGVNQLRSGDCDSVRSVSAATGTAHPYWMLKNVNGFLEAFVTGNGFQQFPRRQLLPEALRLNGVVDVIKWETFKRTGSLWGSKIAPLEIPEERALDIDTEWEMQLAALILENKVRKYA